MIPVAVTMMTDDPCWYGTNVQGSSCELLLFLTGIIT